MVSLRDRRQTLGLTQDAAGHLVVGESTKTGAIRAVALSDRPYGAIARWYESQTIRPHNPAVDFVFATTVGKPLGLDRWQKQHARIIAATGVPRITLHGLRHSFASLALAQGMHPKVVSDILGHSKVQTTMDTYQHVSVDLQRSLLDAMDERLFGSGN